MDQQTIIQKAITELEVKNLPVTRQYLEIHELEYDNKKPRIVHIEFNNEGSEATVHFAVKNERFTLAVIISTDPAQDDIGITTIPYNEVYFSAKSEYLNFAELTSLTTIKPTAGWNKGDKRAYGNSFHTFSALIIEPVSEPGTFETKFLKLLSVLAEDKQGIISLVEKANGYIQVASEMHNGNGMLGGFHIDISCINRMNELGLEINFDLYTSGNQFK